MASKKLYEEVAATLRDLALASSDREIVAAALCPIFKRDNARFDEAVFREACRPPVGPKAVDPETLTRVLIDYAIASDVDDTMPSLTAILDVAKDSAASVIAAAGKKP